MYDHLDEQGQPKIKYDIDVLKDRHIDEFLGICRGVVFDDVVNQKEAEALLKWMEEHKQYLSEYPFNIIHKNLREMLSDGVLDYQESIDLLDVLKSLIGDKNKHENITSGSSSLPFDKNSSKIIFENNKFVFTGVFTTGPRKKCEEIVCDLGGVVQKRVAKNTNFLVIGDIGSEYWVHSSYGRKIEKAVKYRDEGTGIVIVSEQYWAKFI